MVLEIIFCFRSISSIRTYISNKKGIISLILYLAGCKLLEYNLFSLNYVIGNFFCISLFKRLIDTRGKKGKEETFALHLYISLSLLELCICSVLSCSSDMSVYFRVHLLWIHSHSYILRRGCRC